MRHDTTRGRAERQRQRETARIHAPPRPTPLRRSAAQHHPLYSQPGPTSKQRQPPSTRDNKHTHTHERERRSESARFRAGGSETGFVREWTCWPRVARVAERCLPQLIDTVIRECCRSIGIVSDVIGSHISNVLRLLLWWFPIQRKSEHG